MPQQSIRDNEQVAAFAKLAEQYCLLIDRREDISKPEFIKKVAVILAKLFAAGTELIDLPVDLSKSELIKDKTWDKTFDDWKTIFDSLRNKFGEDDQYWVVFNPYIENAPTSPSLGDDLTDIYIDLKRGLSVFGRSERDSLDSVWEWKFYFLEHWGRHCSCALQAIHRLLERMEED